VVGPRFGDAIWEPVRDSPTPFFDIPAGRYPGFARTAREVVARADGDVLRTLTGGGRERTAGQLEALLTRTGFVLEAVLDTPGPVRIAEARAV